MKKWFTWILTGILIFTLAACGSKSQTVTLLYDETDTGIKTTYTLEADGDVVHTITQVTTMDCTDFTEEQFDIINESVEQYKGIYEAIEGIQYDVKITDTSMVETITIDVSNEATVTSLSEQNLMPVEGEGAISLEKTVESMTGQGWTVQE